nr:hypothetical protein BaRGS_003319 [Batillaria attramentaria]
MLIGEGVGVMADLEWLVACPGPGQDVLHDLVARNPKVVSMNGTINAELLSAWTSQAHQSGDIGHMGNAKLTVAALEALPFVRNISSNGTEAFEGLCIDLINALAEELKFTYQLVAPGDGLFGAPEPDGSWNGMVGMVKRGEADMAIGPFTITSIRETVVDFTVPYMEDGGGILTLRKDPNPDLMRMFAPFTTTIWLATGGMVLLFGLVLFFINRFSPYSRQARGGGEASWNVAVSVWIIFSSFMEQGAVKQPRSTSARMVLGCWWVFTVLILSIYTATLAAMLTVTLEPDVIDSIDEVLASDVTPLTLTGTNWDTLFATADTGVYKQIGQRMEAGPDIRDISDAMSHVLKGGAAFLYDISQLDYLYKQDCQNLHLAKKVFNANGLVYVLMDYLILRSILKLQEGGFVEMWRQRWWRGSRQCGGQQQLASLGLGKRLDVVSLAGILFLYGGVVLLCVVVQLAARSGALGRLSDLGRLAGAHVAHPFRHVQVTAALLITADPFPGDGNPHLTNLKLNYGLNILASNSLITVLRSGLYILDLKVQTADYWYTTQSIEWTDSSGALIKNFALFTDFEVAPHHKFLDMHAGDSLRAKPVSTYNGRSPLKTVDIGTQMSLRFVGTKGSNSPSATAAP